MRDLPTLTFTHHDGGRAERGYRGETDDCVVKSIALGLQKPYEVVHRELARRGRRNGRGTPTFIWRSYLRHFPEVQEMKDIPERRMNFWRFFHKHQQGTFLIVVTKHLTIIRDGVVLDEIPPRPRMLVRAAFRVELPSEWSGWSI